jgi:anhydro-N-acetylmuramic acid kinase
VALYVGVMSGTSLDGADAVLAEIGGGAVSGRGHHHVPYADTLRNDLLALNARGDDELHRAALAANAVARVYVQAVQALLAAAGIAPQAVRSIGAHGQTVRHRPQEFDANGYTLQLLNAALLAEGTGIDVVCDFRSRDVAAGGQGAPLVPAFHAERFAAPGADTAVLNIGGIANLTLLPADGPVRGFDCGPGNALMDHWSRLHQGRPFDDGGRWAAGGRIDAALLAALRNEPFFDRAPPKSTGRELFNPEWLAERLPGSAAPADVMATLAELTALSAIDAIERHAPATKALRVCGGGAFNAHLLQRLAALRPGLEVSSTADHGVPPDQVEALAFAWLAWAFGERRAGNRVEVTGAKGARVLGALYPA